MNKAKHIKIVAWLFIINSGLLVLAAVGVLFKVTLAGLFSGQLGAMIASPFVAVVIAVIMVALAMPGLLAGKGLLEGKGWARVLAMVLAAINFLHFPVGTALCIYTFWVLWGTDADHVFEPGYSSRYE